MRHEIERNMFQPFPFVALLDSNWTKPAKKDSVTKTTITKFDQLLPDSARTSINQTARTLVSSMRISAESLAGSLKDKEKSLRNHKIEWHRKISLSLACLVLFLIGAPLGSIIRKGGLGTPLIFAIVFFMIFYFTSTTGEKMAKENTITPLVGMWLSTFILVPLGLFLTYKAMRDSQALNKEFYFRFTRRISRFFKGKQAD